MRLDDCRILIVEDEYMLASELRHELERAGAIVVGPEPSVERALARITQAGRIDVAVLDVNLGGETAFPIAEALKARKIPFIFASGYGDDEITRHFPDAVNCSKPLQIPAMIACLEDMLGGDT